MERDQAVRIVHELLKLMATHRGSDMFITVGAPPSMKVDGKMKAMSKEPLTPEQVGELVRSVMNDKQAADFERTKEANFAIAPKDIGRFRVNAFVQQTVPGMILRVITSDVPTLEKLQLPEILKDLSLTKRGLIIFVGGTGTGKSTSLAAFINHRNENTQGHIITIEDPIEYVHPHKGCIIMQREVGVDTESFEVALKNTLRQAPDVILMGEIRDEESMEHAIAFAETGHLCVATLHANSANQAVDRIINFFPAERHQQLCMDLSLNLRAMISQRLVPKKAVKGRCAVIEILINSPLMADLIFKGKIGDMKELMKRSREAGMQTFDQALFDLYERDEITYEDAMRNADSVNDLRLQIKLNSKRPGNQDLLDGAGGLAILDAKKGGH